MIVDISQVESDIDCHDKLELEIEFQQYWGPGWGGMGDGGHKTQMFKGPGGHKTKTAKGHLT